MASPVESTLVNGASSLITGLSKLLYHKTNTTFAIKIHNSEPHHCDQDYLVAATLISLDHHQLAVKKNKIKNIKKQLAAKKE